MQAEAVALISSDAAAGSAWKELCAASDPAAALSLHSDVLGLLMRCVRGQLPSSSSTAVSEGQLIATLKLVGRSAHVSHERWRLRASQPASLVVAV